MRGMGIGLAAAVFAMSGGAAMAQNVAPDFGAMAKMRQGKSYSDIKTGRFLAEFTDDGQEWIEAETQRQIASPRPLLEMAMDADKALAKDAKELKRRYRVHPLDVTRAVSLYIMKEVQAAATDALGAAQASGDAAAIAAARERLTMANANLEAAEAVQSAASKALGAL
ncbi:MAG TPA: hypothetical protein VF138_02505 [Caulobacteraceae bacterium]